MLRPVLLCWALLVPVNLLLEVQKALLGTGFREPPTPSWGGMLSDAVNFYAIDPVYLLIPLVLLAVTVLAFSLLADGLRRTLN